MPIKRIFLLWFLLVFPSFYAWADIQVNGYLNKAAIENLAADPSCSPASTCPEGRVIFNTTTDQFRIYINGSWTNVASGSSFPLLAPDGSVGAPSYSFSDDTDTGIYSSVNDAVDIAAGGTLSRLTITSTGITAREPVTITDASTNAQLEMNATGGGGSLYTITSRTNGEFRIADTTTGNIAAIRSTNGSWFFGSTTDTGDTFRFRTSGTDGDYIDLGITSTTPFLVINNQNIPQAGSWAVGTAALYGQYMGSFQLFNQPTHASLLAGTTGTETLEVEADGDMQVRGGIATDANATSTDAIKWDVFTGTIAGAGGIVTLTVSGTPLGAVGMAYETVTPAIRSVIERGSGTFVQFRDSTASTNIRIQDVFGGGVTYRVVVYYQ